MKTTKKFLAILMAMMMILSTAAFAEDLPMDGAEPVESATQAQMDAPVAEPTLEPAGMKLYTNEAFTVADYGIITVLGGQFTDVAQARDAADDSMKMTPSAGNTLLVFQVVYHPLVEGQLFTDAFACSVLADKEYADGRKMVECSKNILSVDNSFHRKPDCVDNNRYLVNTMGSNEAIQSYSLANGDLYYLFDYIVEVPAELASSGNPVYLQLNVNGTELYCPM